MDEEHQAALNEVIGNIAAKLARRFGIEHRELVQEGWVHAILGYRAYWEKCSEQSLDGMRGWIYRWVYVRLAMHTRKLTCPVSFPKKAVPDTIRNGVKTVSPDKVAHGTTSMEDDFNDAEMRAKVDAAMGHVFSRYPLAEVTLTREIPATEAAVLLGNPALAKEVRRQTSEARRALKNVLCLTLRKDKTP